MAHRLLTPSQEKFFDDSRNQIIKSGLGAKYLTSLFNRANKLKELSKSAQRSDKPDLLGRSLADASDYLRVLACDEAPIFGVTATYRDESKTFSLIKLSPDNLSKIPHSSVEVGSIAMGGVIQPMAILPCTENLMNESDVLLAIDLRIIQACNNIIF